MNNAFDALIADFIENGVGLGNAFLDTDLCSALRNNLKTLHENDQMRSAHIGKSDKRILQSNFRNDQIYWLDRSHENLSENVFLDIMDELVKYLNQTCYTGITDHEFHYALFPTGSFYKRHLDQFQSDKGRLFTVIFYLNENWEEKDGGQLCVFKGQEQILISPLNGKCVFFKSNELEHEVQVSHQPRMSITGWLRRSTV